MKQPRQERQPQQIAGALAPYQPAFWTPLTELARIHNEFSRVFLRPPWERFLAPATGFFECWSPAFDLYDERSRYLVKAELPGIHREDIHISIQGDDVTISGERRQDVGHREKDARRSELYYGRFQRHIALPHPVDQNRVTAVYKDGILTITLPKTEEAIQKHIEVRVA